MVFSQTTIKTPSILNVVEINHLKPEPDLNGEITGGNPQAPKEIQPMATTSLSEVFLKTEPLFEDTMLNESECEFFQGLEQWCSDPAKEELVQTDSLKNHEDNAQYTDTLHTTFSPSGWDVLDAKSPAQAGYYTPSNPLSPIGDGISLHDNKFLYNRETENKQLHVQEPLWDIPNLPVLIGDLAPEEIIDLNPGSATEPVSYYNTHNSHSMYTTLTNAHKMLLMDEEDSLEMKLNSVTPREVENNNVITEYILNEPEKGGVLERSHHSSGLSLNVAAAPWIADTISTPDVLNYVDQLEREKYILPVTKPTSQLTRPSKENQLVTALSCSKNLTPSVEYNPSTPQSGSYVDSDVEEIKPPSRKRGRRDSEDSDYTPEVEHRQRKTARRKPPVPLKDMILALEESRQMPKARRGRPPKKERRESTVSSVGSIDDNTSSASTHEIKYRELRDKNNEASKRSRMNRKLKELQMEQLVIELEERNKKLKVRADVLEDMTKKLKDALMTAILQK